MGNSYTPEAYVTAGKNRQKIYGNSIFMRDGQEFEFELFNPTTAPVGVLIEINGKRISNTYIVLRPGERSYLERYLDEARKFAFSTYTVDGNDAAAKKAIAQNGSIRVAFHRETARPSYSPPVSTSTYPWNMPTPTIPWNNNIYCGTNTFTSGSGTFTTPTGTIDQSKSSIGTVSDFFSCASTYSSDSIGSFACADNFASPLRPQKLTQSGLETGRVEMGASSGQVFDTYNGQFDAYHFAAVEYKLMPASAKPVEINSLREYCTGCGNRIRKTSWKFCPKCGENLS